MEIEIIKNFNLTLRPKGNHYESLFTTEIIGQLSRYNTKPLKGSYHLQLKILFKTCRYGILLHIFKF